MAGLKGNIPNIMKYVLVFDRNRKRIENVGYRNTKMQKQKILPEPELLLRFFLAKLEWLFRCNRLLLPASPHAGTGAGRKKVYRPSMQQTAGQKTKVWQLFKLGL
jgi:hypothetical protein